MSKKFTLRLETKAKPTRIRNKAGVQIDEKLKKKRQNELAEAIAYCRDNECSAHTALKTKLFPNVKRMTLTRRLSGAVQHGHERDYCRILTVSEENCLVEYIKNRNRSYQPMNRKEVGKIIFNILVARQANNKRMSFRNCTILSANAKAVLQTGKLGRRFWTRFNAAHEDISIKRKGNVSINRALNCTREMAIKHIDELAAELQMAGIMEEGAMEKNGVWTGNVDVTRIFNHDETPQFINYGIDGTPSGLYYAGKGEACQQLIKENRECVTIQPFVSFAGEQSVCQVIFAGKSITSNMVPKGVCEKIPYLLISTTENGVQNAKSLLDAYKLFDKYLTENSIQRPVVVVSDGHSSRFDFDTLSFLREKEIRLFLSPPDTTGLLQLLDQINQMLHRSYKECKEEMFSALQSINREGFMLILSEVWGRWATKEAIANAAKKVGVTPTKMSVEFMQTEKFEKAEKLLKPTETPETTSFSPTKPDVRRYSKEWYKLKVDRLEEELNRSKGAGLDIESVEGLLPVAQKVKKPKISTEKIRVTQEHGSMEGKNILEVVKELKEKKETAVRKKEESLKEKEDNRDAFLRCKSVCVCVCSKEVCEAIGYKQCSKCLNVIKSVCSKKTCLNKDGTKPTMILPAAVVSAQSSGRKRKMARQVESESEDEMKEDNSDEEEYGDVDDDECEEEDEGKAMEEEEEKKEEEYDSDKENENGRKRKRKEADRNPKRQKTLQTLCDEAQESLDDDHISKFYCVYFDNHRYWGKLLKVFADDPDEPAKSVEMAFLHYKFNGYWDYPKGGDVKLIDVKYIFLGPVIPVQTNSLRDGFKFAEDEESLRRYKQIHKNNKSYM